jgi:uncharacterized protein (TIGR02466 family)
MTAKGHLGETHIDRLFPVPLYRAELKVDLESIKAEILDISKGRTLKRNHVINVDSSHGVYGLRQDKFFRSLLDQFLAHAQNFLGELGYDKYFQEQCFIGSSWFNISQKSDSLGKHIHPGAILSGAFYVEANKEDQISFFRQDEMILPATKMNALSEKVATYRCEPGKLMIFKSNLNHNTNAKEGGRKIVISFNVNKKSE